jgi:hypothetical protein
VGHLLYLHISGSSNPVGTTGNGDRAPFHPYFAFKLRQCNDLYICRGMTAEQSKCFESPNLGNMGNHLPNRACSEKVIRSEKLLSIELSEKDNMVKTILFQVYYPVPSSEAEFLGRIEKLYIGSP